MLVGSVQCCCVCVRVASFPGSPSFRAIIPRMTFDPLESARKEGEPGNEATCVCLYICQFCEFYSVCLIMSLSNAVLFGVSCDVM